MTNKIMEYLQNTFNCEFNHFTYNTFENMIDYAVNNFNHSENQLAYYLSNIIDELEFEEINKIIIQYNIEELNHQMNISDDNREQNYLNNKINELKNKLNEEEKETRTCSECKKEITQGYCIENGEEYYCSDECLHKHYTQDEYLEMYDNGNGESYWTEWEG